MEREGGLTKAEREMIVVATSGANDCLYCIVAHGAILRIYAKNPLVADQVAANYRKADITPRQKAMLAFALKVALASAEIVDDDFAALRAHGFSDEDIWDIGAIAAFFALSNRMANLIRHAAERRVLPAGARAEEVAHALNESENGRHGRPSCPESTRPTPRRRRTSRTMRAFASSRPRHPPCGNCRAGNPRETRDRLRDT